MALSNKYASLEFFHDWANFITDLPIFPFEKDGGIQVDFAVQVSDLRRVVPKMSWGVIKAIFDMVVNYVPYTLEGPKKKCLYKMSKPKVCYLKRKGARRHLFILSD